MIALPLLARKSRSIRQASREQSKHGAMSKTANQLKSEDPSPYTGIFETCT